MVRDLETNNKLLAEIKSRWELYICPILKCIKVKLIQGQTHHSAGQHPHCVTISAKLRLPQQVCVFKNSSSHSTAWLGAGARATQHRLELQAVMTGGGEGERWSNNNWFTIGRQISKNRKTLHHQHLSTETHQPWLNMMNLRQWGACRGTILTTRTRQQKTGYNISVRYRELDLSPPPPLADISTKFYILTNKF